MALTMRARRSDEKYTGDNWTWGATITIRDSKGRKKQVPAPADEVVHVRRPDLRIIEPELWERAQKQVADIDEIFGSKKGQKKRGPKVHFSHVYPKNILFKLLRCGECSGEMHQNMSREWEYRQCKNAGKGPDDCRAKTRVPADETRRVLTEFAAELLLSVPDWLHAAIVVMNDMVRDRQTQLPAKVEDRRQQQRDLIERRRRLFEMVETGELKYNSQPQSPVSSSFSQSSIRERFEELDGEIGHLAAEISKDEQQLESLIQLPDHDWIVAEIEKLPCVLRTDNGKAAQLLGELFDVVRVYRVILPGKQRGYQQLRFRLKAWRIIRTALDGQLPSIISETISADDGGDACMSPEFCVDVGGPTRADSASAYIVKRRGEGDMGRNSRRDRPWAEDSPRMFSTMQQFPGVQE